MFNAMLATRAIFMANFPEGGVVCKIPYSYLEGLHIREETGALHPGPQVGTFRGRAQSENKTHIKSGKN